jgi:GTP-binding protein EngB required for normal cell division
MTNIKCAAGKQNSDLLNEYHQLRLRVTFQHIDAVLTEVEHILVDSVSDSPFNRYNSDTAPIQQKVAHEYVLRIRATMTRILKAQQIPFGKPHCGSRWAANTALLYAAVAVDELDPDRLRGYGRISDAGDDFLETIRAELHSLIAKLQTYLAQDANADLQVRIERLEKVRNDVLPLEDLGRIITSHGLVEYREALSMIIDRMENKVFEIGIFGRVSSGKSSLLNYLLEVDYLPVGVTPVTAVPTRISYGPIAQVGIEYADNPPEIVSFSELWKYATEQGNSNNTRHVSRIHLKLPTSRLEEGIAFVDTPGLGSLATSGSAETLAYLPRCDLGLLMIDASLGVAVEDFAVVDALYRAGGTVMILISKADLFNSAERSQMIEYVARQIEHELRILPPIFPVSVRGESSVLCDNWCKEHLQPMLTSHQELAAAATNRKITVLRNALIATLETRQIAGGQSVASEELKNREVLTAFGEVERSFDRIVQRSVELGRRISGQAPLILKVTVDRIAVSWRNRSAAEPSQILRATITELLAQPIAQMEEQYDCIRKHASSALHTAEKSFPHGLSLELPGALGMPPLDPSSLARKLQEKRPALAHMLILPLVKWQLRRRFQREMLLDLSEFLDLYTKLLRSWFRESMDALKKAFESAADIYRIQLQKGRDAHNPGSAANICRPRSTKSESITFFCFPHLSLKIYVVWQWSLPLL